MLKLNKEKLDLMVEEGWLMSQTHPYLDLTIYNYSQKTQYEKYWTEETLACRGLVMNSKGDVVARPFKKFFNASEVEGKIPNLPFEVFEKMDGSLGIAFYYCGVLVFCSRGSFASEQAICGRVILEKYDWVGGFKEGFTYLFEIIYPENRIVVDYFGAEKLVVLGVVETETGREVGFGGLEGYGFDVVNKYDFEDYKTIKDLNWDNHEGFVVRFSNGYRIKIKFDEYVRLHAIVTEISTTSIWEIMKNGGDFSDLLDMVPDEFYEWAKGVEKDIRDKFDTIYSEAHNTLSILVSELGDAPRKEYALAIKDSPYKSIVFNLMDNKSVDEIIWKMVKPKWYKPFGNSDF
jgi:RNA ligase